MAFPQKFLTQLARSQELSEGKQTVFVELFGTGQSRIEVQQKLHISETNFNTRLGNIYKKFRIASDKGRGKENHLRDYLENQYKIWKDKTASPSSATSTITEPHWREIFLLAAGMIRNADNFVRLMKQQIDQLLAGDEKLSDILHGFTEKIPIFGQERPNREDYH
jgi:hypothetical protein